jgi:DNA-binding beta-propeller fold protein YncE
MSTVAVAHISLAAAIICFYDLMMSQTHKLFFGVLTLGLLVSSPLRAGAAPLTADAPIQVPDSSGGFDFLKIDAAKNRLLANHTGNNTLDVFDLTDGKLLKHIPTGKAQDVAVDDAGGNYFVGVSQEQKIVIIDSTKLEVTSEIKLDGPADAIVLDPKRHQLYVGHDDEKELWVLDMAEKKLTATIAIPPGPEVVVYDAAADKIFQNIKTNDTVLTINPETHAIVQTWSTAPAKSPHGLAYNPSNHHLFCAGTNGKLAVLDAETGKAVGSVDIAKGVDQIAFDPSNQRIYCACGSGKISVVEDAATGPVSLGDIDSAPGAKTIACDPKTHAVWIAYASKAASFIQRFQVK